MIIALAGLPGSGKTFVRKKIEDFFPNFLTFSPDEHENGWNDLNIQLPILIDAPWLLETQNLRFKQFFSQTKVVFLSTPIDICYKQQQERGRVMSKYSWQAYLQAYHCREDIKHLFASWQEVDQDSAFDMIVESIVSITNC